MIALIDPALMRGMSAALVVAAYLALCSAVVWRERRKRAAAGTEATALAQSSDTNALIVAYASQTGFAEELAWHAARSLHTAGVATRVLPLSELTIEALNKAGRALFLVSTCGEGDPPDNGVAFSRKLMAPDAALSDLRYGMLALGDRAYANFCAYGRGLDEWLRRRGAQPLFERVDVDNASEPALRAWQHQLGHVAGTTDLPEWKAPEYESWRLTQRRHLNPGSAGNATFHIELTPNGELPQWESGDLVQIQIQCDPDRPREYSIGSLTSEMSVHLLVRLERRDDGGLGVASGWLTQHAQLGDEVRLRVRKHGRFRLEGNIARPLIFIGNGTGLAGLRGHLKARAAAGSRRNWLVFGERNAAHDFYYREEIEAWREQGVIERMDIVFSRDQPERRYVQHALLDAADDVRRWLDDGAAIYVCGSLDGMAAGVDAALKQIAGESCVERLVAEGRYRRDVY